MPDDSPPRLPTDANFRVGIDADKLVWVHTQDGYLKTMCSVRAQKDELPGLRVRLSCPLASCAALWTGSSKEEEEGWAEGMKILRDRNKEAGGAEAVVLDLG